MDVRVVAKLLSSKIGEEPEDLDQLLDKMGVHMTWREKLELLQHLPDVEAVYHAVSGKILIRRVKAAL
jgi:vacuolar-type H+-ATPase subunit C/Vma6